MHDDSADIAKTSRYVARVLQQHLVEDANRRFWTSHGSAVFIDISGFTKLSERLARKGREGAEQISHAIGLGGQALIDLAQVMQCLRDAALRLVLRHLRR